MDTAEVVIVGGGIVGSSIAYHLTQAGCRDVLVIERETHQGKGSTGKSMGGVRAQFATPVNIRMSLYSIPFYAGFEEHTGHDSGYRAQGYLPINSVCEGRARTTGPKDKQQSGNRWIEQLWSCSSAEVLSKRIRRTAAARSPCQGATTHALPACPWSASSRNRPNSFLVERY